MAAKVIWLREALDDLDEVLTYIEKRSPKYATIVGESIVAAANDLQMFPLMGSIVREREEGDLRQRIVYSYRIIYRAKENVVEILAVLHSARQLPEDIASRKR